MDYWVGILALNLTTKLVTTEKSEKINLMYLFNMHDDMIVDLECLWCLRGRSLNIWEGGGGGGGYSPH